VEPPGGFQDHHKFLSLEYSAADVRYTQSKDGDRVYAICLGWPESDLTLSAVQVRDAEPEAKVELLGHNGALPHEITEDRQLVVRLPDLPVSERPGQHAYSFRLTGFELDAASTEQAAE
jgi:hypothetical protein